MLLNALNVLENELSSNLLEIHAVSDEEIIFSYAGYVYVTIYNEDEEDMFYLCVDELGGSQKELYEEVTHIKDLAMIINECSTIMSLDYL